MHNDLLTIANEYILTVRPQDNPEGPESRRVKLLAENMNASTAHFREPGQTPATGQLAYCRLEDLEKGKHYIVRMDDLREPA